MQFIEQLETIILKFFQKNVNMLLEKKRCLSILLMTDISSDEENSDYSDEGNSN